MIFTDNETTYADILGCNSHNRKGKNILKNKKLKKYEAKSQKINLIRSKNHKAIYNDRINAIPFIDSNTKFNNLLDIIKASDNKELNDAYEYYMQAETEIIIGDFKYKVKRRFINRIELQNNLEILYMVPDYHFSQYMWYGPRCYKMSEN